jgi:hypothetical protein
MAKSVGMADRETPEMPLPSAFTIAETAALGELLKFPVAGEPRLIAPGGGLSAPVLVLDSERTADGRTGQVVDPHDSLVGIITAFDLL